MSYIHTHACIIRLVQKCRLLYYTTITNYKHREEHPTIIVWGKALVIYVEQITEHILSQYVSRYNVNGTYNRCLEILIVTKLHTTQLNLT